jgi:hypothetical protein
MNGVHFQRADIVGASMPGLVVTNSHFKDVDARGADLRGAVFDSCRFDRVNFRGANLKEAEFVNCDFDAVDLRGTVFQVIGPEGPFSASVSGRIIPGNLDLDMVGHDVLDRPSIASLFGEIYRQIEARPDDEDSYREEIHNLIGKIEKRVTTKGQADGRQIESWLKRLAWMDSDAFWLTASILTNPLTGIDSDFRWAARETKRQVEQAQEADDAPR